MRSCERGTGAKPTAMTDDGSLGTVAVLRRYPVKSMLGEDLRACEVTGRVQVGDGVNPA